MGEKPNTNVIEELQEKLLVNLHENKRERMRVREGEMKIKQKSVKTDNGNNTYKVEKEFRVVTPVIL